MIRLKRVYEPATTADGTRILVERLWPRGIRKADLKLHRWLKDIAPSNKLRRWFAHDPKKWDVFRQRYFAELDRNPEVWEPLVKAARRGPVTFVYSSRDPDHNNALALKDYLQAKLKRSATTQHSRVA